MKYIRTKDGRILIAPDLYDNGGIFLASDPPMYETRNAKNECSYVFCHDVIKQADTIEELCDEFVSIDNYGNKSIGNDFEVAKAKYKILNAGAVKMLNGDVYGAIWTDKGLIYVAKMNDKGELCLL